MDTKESSSTVPEPGRRSYHRCLSESGFFRVGASFFAGVLVYHCKEEYLPEVDLRSGSPRVDGGCFLLSGFAAPNCLCRVGCDFSSLEISRQDRSKVRTASV